MGSCGVSPLKSTRAGVSDFLEPYFGVSRWQLYICFQNKGEATSNQLACSSWQENPFSKPQGRFPLTSHKTQLCQVACLLCTSFKGNQESENLAFPGLPSKRCSLPQEADRGEARGLPFFWFGSWAVLGRCREGGEQENGLGEESISPLGSALCGCGRQAAYAVSVRRSSPPQQVIADFSFLSGLEMPSCHSYSSPPIPSVHCSIH